MLLNLRNGLQTTCCVRGMAGTAAPHTLQIICVYIYRYRMSMLHEMGANVSIQSRCSASPATPRREIASRAGCWLRSTAEGHWSPSVTVQAVTARCVGRNSQNRGQRACFAAVGCDGVFWTQLSPYHPSPRTQATSLACNRQVPCPTQRTHATQGRLWVARWCPTFSKKDPL
jgi:hypothetical protein